MARRVTPTETPTVNDTPVAEQPRTKRAYRKSTLDLGSLSVQASERKIVSVPRGRAPFTPPAQIAEALDYSWAERQVKREYRNPDGSVHTTYIGQAMEIVVDTDNAKALVSLIRRSAEHYKLGVAVSQEDMGDGRVLVLFAAQTRKQPRKN